MSKPSPNEIVVNVKLRVPLSGGSVEVEVEPLARREFERMVMPLKPGVNESNVPVRIDPNTNIAYICAEGISKKGHEVSSRVWANVYPGASGPVDLTPPSSARSVVPNQITGRYLFHGGNAAELPGVAFANTGPGADNRLAIWEDFSTGQERTVYNFQAIRGTGTVTQCDPLTGTGTGSGSGSGMFGPPFHEPLPVQWKVIVIGVKMIPGHDNAPRLNAAWTLTHRGGLVWDTGDKGCCVSLLPTARLSYCDQRRLWQLDLNGLAAYHAAASALSFKKTNRLALASFVTGADGLPSYLNLQPIV